MGVSVSASTAIIVAGLFFAFTAFYPVAANGFDRVSSAEHDVHDRALERQNTAIGIATAEVRDGNVLVVNVTNDGATGLVVADTTLVVDNEYVDLADVDTTVYDRDEPTGETDLWLTGETLAIELVDDDVEGNVSDADRVGVVTAVGVRDVATIEDAGGGS